jgi:ABC-type branched-subunit amino acid transport system ATPase component/ABC-type branched-subunit amino acid transport system permease subunit
MTNLSSLSNGIRLGIATLIALAVTLPLLLRSEYALFVATQLCVYYLVALGLNVLTGYGGQTSIGHGALVATGAYVTALLTVDGGVSFWIALPLSMAASAVLGTLMALPGFRLSAWYFALITLAFARVVAGLLTEWSPLTHGFDGVIGIPSPSIAGYVFSARDLYWFALLLSALAFLLTRNIAASRYGRALQALRDNPLAGVSAGVSLGRLKIYAFAYSAILAGAAGALFAVQKTVITPDDFTIDLSIFFLLVVVVGGLGRLHGPLLGTLTFFLLPELMSGLESWRLLVYGALLLLLVLYLPDGVAGGLDALTGRLTRGRSEAATTDIVGATHRPRVNGAALSVRQVVKRFGGVPALNEASLEVPAGSITAIVGPNGSGKTTLLNVTTGFYPIDSGSITLDGQDISWRSAASLARSGVRRTFQTPKLLPNLSVIENVMLGDYSSEKASLLSLVVGTPFARKERRERMAEAMRHLRFVGLDRRADLLAGETPHGQQRLIEIARALAGEPRLLLLDEPAAGLSMTELDGLCSLIRDIAALGTTIIIVEHHLDLVTKLADAVHVLERGEVIASGSAESVFADEYVLKAYMGHRAVTAGAASDAA